MNNRERPLQIIFWLLAAAGIALIVWKFFFSQEQPMESKILFVFFTFAVGSFLFRWFAKKGQSQKLERWSADAIEWSDTGVSAVLLAFFIMAFIMQAFKIPSGSMQPTLLIGDHLFVNKFIYGTQLPFTLKKLWNLKKVKRYDVIVFLCPPSALPEEERKAGVKKDFIKRATALEGDVVEIKNKRLFINGEKAEDSRAYFIYPSTYPRLNLWNSQAEYQKNWERGDFARMAEAVRDNFGPVKVPPNHFFVLGDNRDGSFDSRFWGPLPDKYLKGKAWLVYWPLRRFQKIR